VRCQASVHLGLAGVVSVVVVGFECFLVALESLPRKTREKKGIFGGRFELRSAVVRTGRFPLSRRHRVGLFCFFFLFFGLLFWSGV
jgi:hypothetical protein